VNDNGAAAARGGPSLPRHVCLPINRCNLPALILGSLTFQRHPSALALDGVAQLHRDLVPALDAIADAAARARHFMDYMTVHFRLEHLGDAGLIAASPRNRAKANYLRVVRGWAFDADGRDGAVLKGWVESRFGLLPRFHRVPLRDFSSPGYRAYLEERAAGLYGTNALEAQLDLLYTYCQYELMREPMREPTPGRMRTQPGTTRLRLYRGTNRLSEHEVLSPPGSPAPILLLNNLSSFSASRERAGEFGDYITEVWVPLSKIFFYQRLLPGMLSGEDEYAVIGGLYQVSSSTL
jgi:NAD+---dinitrogen-reductase ADP-D-ribosyltransferase